MSMEPHESGISASGQTFQETEEFQPRLCQPSDASVSLIYSVARLPWPSRGMVYLSHPLTRLLSGLGETS